MDFKENKKYICKVNNINCEFFVSFEKGQEIKFIGETMIHSQYGKLYLFSGERYNNFLKKEWVEPMKNNIRKLVIK